MSPRFLQIHTLTSYPASLLNRDDAGFAKRIPFGGHTRTRISSQCLKRHWRTFDGLGSLREIRVSDSVRSRVSLERYVVKPLLDENFSESVVTSVIHLLMNEVFGFKDKSEKPKKSGKSVSGDKDQPKSSKQDDEGLKKTSVGKTEQVTVLGPPELDYLLKLARDLCKEANGNSEEVRRIFDQKLDNKTLRENLSALLPGNLAAGLSAALFGRMVTGDVLSRCDAAIHVAHSFTVHSQSTESDYFSAIDDIIKDEGESASGHINAAELASGLFYGYVVVDIEGLAKNVGGDRKLASAIVGKLVHIIPTVSPGAKLGSTAPYAYSHLVLLESGIRQPRSLANAFLAPVRVTSDHDILQGSYKAIKSHLDSLDAMYGKPDTEMRIHAGLDTAAHFSAPASSLDEVAKWAAHQVES